MRIRWRCSGGDRLSIQNEGVSGQAGLEIVRVGGWERFGWLRHGFSRRMGGVSSVYGGKTLNLGWTKEDDPVLVAENRRRFLLEVGGENCGFSLAGVRQIHSGIVRGGGGGGGALEGR